MIIWFHLPYINVLIELLKDKYKLYIAKSGEQAIKRIENNQPDLILLDIMMPDMDGYQTCLLIKKNPLWATIPHHFSDRENGSGIRN